MDSTAIADRAELAARIAHLRAQKTAQEAGLKYAFKEFIDTLNPIEMAKKSLHTLAADKVVQFDLAKIGLTLGTNFLINQLMGHRRSIKGLVGSTLVEMLSTTLINNNAPQIIEGIRSLVSSQNGNSAHRTPARRTPAHAGNNGYNEDNDYDEDSDEDNE